MKVSRIFSLISMIAMCLVALLMPSLSVHAKDAGAKAQTNTKNDGTVVIQTNDFSRDFIITGASPATSFQPFTAPPAALPIQIKQNIRRKFHGYRISTNFGKIPIKPLNINAIGRREPDFVPLN